MRDQANELRAAVHEARARLHSRELLRAEHARGLGRDGRMEAHEVALGEEGLERDAQRAGQGCPLGRDVRIGDEHARSEAPEAVADFSSDRAEPDQPHGLLPELPAAKLRECLPHFPHVARRDVRTAQEFRCIRELSRQHQQECKRQVGYGVGVAAGGTQHRNTECRACVDVDVHRVPAAGRESTPLISPMVRQDQGRSPVFQELRARIRAKCRNYVACGV